MIQEETLEPDHPNLAVTLNSLGLVAHDLSELAVAETLFKRALAIREKVLPDDHLDLAETLEGYAALLQDMGRTGEATELETRAKAIRSRAQSA